MIRNIILSKEDEKIYFELSKYKCLLSEEKIVMGIVCNYAQKHGCSLRQAVDDLLYASIIKEEDEQ